MEREAGEISADDLIGNQQLEESPCRLKATSLYRFISFYSLNLLAYLPARWQQHLHLFSMQHGEGFVGIKGPCLGL